MREIFDRLREWWYQLTTPTLPKTGEPGQVWMAPIGTPLPVDETKPWNMVDGEWKHLGYVTDPDPGLDYAVLGDWGRYAGDDVPVRPTEKLPPLTYTQTVAFENWPWEVMDNVDITDTSWVDNGVTVGEGITNPEPLTFQLDTDWLGAELRKYMLDYIGKAVDAEVFYGTDVDGHQLHGGYHNPAPSHDWDNINITAQDYNQPALDMLWDQIRLDFNKPIDFNKFKEKTVPAKAEKPTKVQVTFNRVFTYAEREAFRDFLSGGVTDTTFKWIGDKKHANRVILESSVDSRDLVADVSEIVEEKFLNVYPVAAKTIRPRVEV